MFSLLVAYNPDTWDQTPYQCDRTRYLEYTAEHIREQYRDLSVQTLRLLKQLPVLFSIEGEEKDSRIGYIETIKVRDDHLLIEYKFDPILPSIPKGAITKLEKQLDIRKWEIIRTHWAIKDSDLFVELTRGGYLSQDQVEAATFFRNRKVSTRTPQNTIDQLNNDHVFIVHGHDDQSKQEVAAFINSLGLVPIILHEQANLGKTIIEKIEAYTNVGFAVVLYTPCDLGNSKGMLRDLSNLNPRARQNVVLEHGYLMAKLGRSRVAALVRGKVETPNDISGVVYIDFDLIGNWQKELQREIVVSGIQIKNTETHSQK